MTTPLICVLVHGFAASVAAMAAKAALCARSFRLVTILMSHMAPSTNTPRVEAMAMPIARSPAHGGVVPPALSTAAVTSGVPSTVMFSRAELDAALENAPLRCWSSVADGDCSSSTPVLLLLAFTAAIEASASLARSVIVARISTLAAKMYSCTASLPTPAAAAKAAVRRAREEAS